MIADILVNFVLQVISTFGYIGIFLLMAAESTVLPVPSELVLPFAGYLIFKGNFGLIELIIIALAGSIIGSLISYYIGKTIGRSAILRFGKGVFLEEKHLDIAHNWFEKYGEKTVFFCRFVPAIRHVISIPAGIAEMNLGKFVVYTAAGALCWNSMLIASGIILQKNWDKLATHINLIDSAILIAVILLILFFVYKHRKRKN